MSFNSFTITDGTNFSYGMLDQLKPFIDGHAAWEFVETVLGTPTTRRADVYRCLGSQNGAGSDFYVAIGALTGVGAVGFMIGEGYDAVNKKLQKGAIYGASTPAITPAADGTYAIDRHVANENSAMVATAGFLFAAGGAGAAGTAPTAGAIVQISVTSDRLVCSWGSVGSVYTGLVDRFIPWATDPMPLVTCNLAPNVFIDVNGSHVAPGTQVKGASTREFATASVTYAFHCSLDGPQAMVPNGSGATTGKDAITGQWLASRARFMNNNRRPNTRGYSKDMLLIAMGDLANGVGDTVQLDGADYTCVAVNAGKHSAFIRNAA